MIPYCEDCTRKHTCDPYTTIGDHGHCDEKQRKTNHHQQYERETGADCDQYPDKYIDWIETKCDTLEAQIIGMHAALAKADKERDMYKDMAISFARLTEIFSTTEECTKIAHKWLAKEREKERGQ